MYRGNYSSWTPWIDVDSYFSKISWALRHNCRRKRIWRTARSRHAWRRGPILPRWFSCKFLLMEDRPTGWYAEFAMICRAPFQISCDTSYQQFFGGAGWALAKSIYISPHRKEFWDCCSTSLSPEKDLLHTFQGFFPRDPITFWEW